MMAMKSENQSYSRRTALGELKALLHKLITGEIRGDVLDLAAIATRTHGLPSR